MKQAMFYPAENQDTLYYDKMSCKPTDTLPEKHKQHLLFPYMCLMRCHIFDKAIMYSGLPNVCCGILLMLIRTGKPKSCQTREGRGGQIIKEKRKGSKEYCRLKRKYRCGCWKRNGMKKG